MWKYVRARVSVHLLTKFYTRREAAPQFQTIVLLYAILTEEGNP